MSANPRDPAFEEALEEGIDAFDVASYNRGVSSEKFGYCSPELGVAFDHARNGLDAAIEARVTRAVRDTREACAKAVEREWALSEGSHAFQRHVVAVIRALTSTPERLYTDAEVESMVSEAFMTGRIYNAGGEKEKPVEIQAKLHANVERARRVASATAAPETNNG